MRRNMFLWKFPCGYAKIVLVCARPERFINEALRCGVPLHNIRRVSKRELTALVRLNGADALCELAHECGAELRIIKTGGAAVLVSSLLSRGALLIGLFAALLLMALLSKRVLLISVDGANGAAVRAVRALIEDELRLRTKRIAQLDRELIAARIAEADPSIALASIDFDGVVMRVHLIERTPEPEEDDALPSSIHADRDCVIIRIAAREGRAAVRAGDAVRKGELLISGDVTPEQGGEARFVHARGEIVGEVARRIAVRVEPVCIAPVKGEDSAEVCAIDVFGLRLVSASGFSDSSLELTASAALDAAFIPLRVSKGVAHRLVLGEKRLTHEQMLEEAEAEMAAKLIAALPEDAMIVSKSTELLWDEDGALLLTATVHTYEKIGFTRYL